MAFSFVKKNGLLYTEDLQEIIGVDIETQEFTGKIPFGAKSIDDEVFTDSPYEQISVPESIKKIGNKCFAESKVLEHVKLPSTLKDLSEYLFSGCSSLQSVKMPLEVNSFPQGLFKDCSSLEDIPFRAGLTELSKEVFCGCSSVKSLVIPNTVKRIESLAIANCTSLKALVLPSQLEFIAQDAFDGTDNVQNIRIEGTNNIFYISEEDGCLYEKTQQGDVLRLKVLPNNPVQINFYKENVDDETDDFFSDEDFDEIDETFSPEVSSIDESSERVIIEKQSDTITQKTEQDESFEQNIEQEEELSATEEEFAAITTGNVKIPSGKGFLAMATKLSEQQSEETDKSEETQIKNVNSVGENTMDLQESNIPDQNMEDMFAQIMSEEKQRTESTDGVAVSEEEGKILTQMMDVMSDVPSPVDTAKVTDDDLADLFSNNEEQFKQENYRVYDDAEIDSKIKILMNAAKYCKVIEFTPEGESPTESDLFVIAEKTIPDENGSPSFTKKLENCCRKFAKIQDFKRVYFLNELPIEDPEFNQFFYYFMSQKNTIFACEANCPANLSDYAKQICKQAKISLNHDELVQQKKMICIKNNGLIKLIIRDIYTN